MEFEGVRTNGRNSQNPIYSKVEQFWLSVFQLFISKEKGNKKKIKYTC